MERHEDGRPASNAGPYKAAVAIIKTATQALAQNALHLFASIHACIGIHSDSDDPSKVFIEDLMVCCNMVFG